MDVMMWDPAIGWLYQLTKVKRTETHWTNTYRNVQMVIYHWMCTPAQTRSMHSLCFGRQVDNIWVNCLRRCLMTKACLDEPSSLNILTQLFHLARHIIHILDFMVFHRLKWFAVPGRRIIYFFSRWHLNVLQWARSEGCPWDRNKCLILAKENSADDVVRWIEEHTSVWIRV